MRKYLLIFVTSILLSFGLCACGNNGSIEAPPQTDVGDGGEDSDGIPEAPPGDDMDTSVAFYVTVSINPEFQLYVNKDMQIFEVYCKNQGVENLYPQLNLLGLTYDTALEEILNKAIQNNYLFNNSKIQVDVKRAGGEFEQQERDYFDSANKSTLDKVKASSGLMIDFVSKVIFDAEDYIIEEYNSDGYLVYFAYIHGDGNLDHEYSRKYYTYNPLTYDETYYQPQEGTTFYTYTCDGNGIPILKSWTEVNGESYEATLDNGVITYRKHFDSAGELWEEEWFAGEEVTRKLEYRYYPPFDETDGCSVVTEYVNGHKVKEFTTRDSGNTEVTTYENDKMISKEVVYDSGQIHEYSRYDNEVLIYYRSEFSDGTYSEKKYNSDGLLIFEEGYAAKFGDKHSTTYTVGSNGLYTYSIYESNDGYKSEIYYDAQGKPSSWTDTKPDGTISSGSYDANGNRIP